MAKCEKCGAENAGGAVFCTLCFTRFDDEAASGEEASPVAPGDDAPFYEKPYVPLDKIREEGAKELSAVVGPAAADASLPLALDIEDPEARAEYMRFVGFLENGKASAPGKSEAKSPFRRLLPVIRILASVLAVSLLLARLMGSSGGLGGYIKALRDTAPGAAASSRQPVQVQQSPGQPAAGEASQGAPGSIVETKLRAAGSRVLAYGAGNRYEFNGIDTSWLDANDPADGPYAGGEPTAQGTLYLVGNDGRSVRLGMLKEDGRKAYLIVDSSGMRLSD